MELRQLRYFVTVAQTRHFGRAAERLHMAQSPLSQAIRQLESQVGATLLDRTTRRVDLTAAGEAFLADAVRILASVEDARTRVEHIAAGHTGVLTVGTTDLAAYRVLPRLARAAAREMPGVTLRFVPGLLTAGQEEALVERRIDVGVLRPPLVRPGLTVRPLEREAMVVAVRDGHRLAGAGPVRLADLQSEEFVAYGVPGSVVDSVVVQACLNEGFLPRRVGEAAQTPILLTLVAAGTGVAVLPESVRALRVDGVTYLPLADEITVDLALAWRSEDSSPALTRLLDALESGGLLPDPLDTDPEPTADIGGTT
ncbi:LysR substrate-binding domain-containing protein [Pseudonocardia sp. KRD291]|uniref:LysR substrate-binding domain-containing protein n=1 Tax=Pseudonocardia sp. KRD291 TaxID=2792007 RepID=UPI001C4A1D7F|nr:LysR substrate-binding domain-containing protein [Pseudonocardia sp. KRD291]MBW0103622.1 LysR family transcriptional regulator [Pseudonocardia sp. KRD291]